MKGLINRAQMLCDKQEDLLEELTVLQNVFVANGYPKKLAREIFDRSWTTQILKGRAGGETNKSNGFL